MNDLLYNPTFHALNGRDAHLGTASGQVRYFDAEVSPFAGFPTGYEDGFDELHAALPLKRRIVYARPDPINQPRGWKILVDMPGLQFVFQHKTISEKPGVTPVALDKTHVPDMVALATLTKPGPFNDRTIEFGKYYGIIVDGRLAAMTGERMHPGDYTEISAVCTHPDFSGRGYAASLIVHQLKVILESGEKPFLHVRADNDRAIGLYERLGFKLERRMNFYFLEKS